MTTRAVRWIAIAVGAALVTIAIVAGIGSRTSSLRSLVVSTLSERLDSEVELSGFSVDTFPTVTVQGDGLVIRHRGRRDVPPLVSVKSFTVTGGVLDLIRRPRRFRVVTLDGLEINIPPDGLNIKRGASQPSDEQPPVDAEIGPSPLIVERLFSRDATLRIIPRRADKDPKEFAIHTLEMSSLGLGQQMPFKAELTNPIPKGAIQTNGTFGPWRREDPGATPLSGHYVFGRADLDTIKGIGGILDSTGDFSGQLNRIAVKGQTTTPDFHIDISGQPVPLNTRFEAVVDGTDGDTYLNDVDATLQKTSISAKGEVTGTKGVKGRTIKLDVRIPDGRIEDLLRLAIKAEQPLMVGDVTLHTDFLLPPGEPDVIDRLELAGQFGLESATFTDRDVQKKLAEMSKRAKGADDPRPPENVMTDLRGRFRLKHSLLSFSNLTFAIPGATVNLQGTYALKSEAIEFDGTLRMQATISEAAGGGMKSVFLKLVDPLFRDRKSGAVVPIKVTGTREKPKFGVDIGRVFKHVP
jgi:AsmA-like C-terminal region